MKNEEKMTAAKAKLSVRKIEDLDLVTVTVLLLDEEQKNMLLVQAVADKLRKTATKTKTRQFALESLIHKAQSMMPASNAHWFTELVQDRYNVDGRDRRLHFGPRRLVGDFLHESQQEDESY